MRFALTSSSPLPAGTKLKLTVMMIFQIYFSDLEVGRCKETSNLQKVGELIGVNMVLLDKKHIAATMLESNENHHEVGQQGKDPVNESDVELAYVRV
ncbi:hypothetical protein YC2023_121743 [Brassica napus]